jgi:predicted SAM-dependent methyltransferase
MKLLNLGCGQKYHPDWVNVNFYKSGEKVLVHDLNHPFPWADETFDVVYHSHVLEHFTKENAKKFLKECKRVLKPNGIHRVVVPDLEGIVNEYISNLYLARKGETSATDRYNWILYELFDQIQRNYSGGGMIEYWKKKPLPAKDYIIERMGSEVKNLFQFLESQSVLHNPAIAPKTLKVKIQDRLLAWMGYTREMAEIGKFRLSGEVHYWMYDEFSLSKLLEELEFRDYRRVSADESSIFEFNKYLLDIEDNGQVRKPDSLFMEAIK